MPACLRVPWSGCQGQTWWRLRCYPSSGRALEQCAVRRLEATDDLEVVEQAVEQI